jgi:hypothetical protein
MLPVEEKVREVQTGEQLPEAELNDADVPDAHSLIQDVLLKKHGIPLNPAKHLRAPRRKGATQAGEGVVLYRCGEEQVCQRCHHDELRKGYVTDFPA